MRRMSRWGCFGEEEGVRKRERHERASDAAMVKIDS